MEALLFLAIPITLLSLESVRSNPEKLYWSCAFVVAGFMVDRINVSINSLQTARQLGSLPATEDALRDGRLSEAQTREIAGAAIHKPDAEDERHDENRHDAEHRTLPQHAASVAQVGEERFDGGCCSG